MFLLIGGDSEIGAATAQVLTSKGYEVATTSRRAGAGLFLDFEQIDQFNVPEGTKAACIFVAVARLAACANDPRGSREINVSSTLKLTDALLRSGVYTLFLSTNQVFDGSIPNTPADAPHSPVSVYGQQKAETETALMGMMAAGQPVGVLRLAKVVSQGMKLITDWDRILRDGRPVKAFADMTMAPTPVAVVAGSIGHMLVNRETVVAQLTGPRDLSYADVARFIARRAGVAESLVIEGSAFDAGLPAGATPMNTTLDSTWLCDRSIMVPDVLNVIDEALGSNSAR